MNASTVSVFSIPVDKVKASPTQPRTRFVGLDELADSIKKTNGVLQPVTVRTKGDAYELVFGERRTRATKLAGLKSIAAIVRDDMTDEQVEEAQLVENVQRSDLDPIEEGSSYAKLRDRHGYTTEQIAERASKSKSYVLLKIKLTEAGTEARKAFDAGKLHESALLYVARLPAKLQAAATKELVTLCDQRDGDPIGAREAAKIVRSKFMLRLVDATFDRKDAQLVPEAGACTTCPKRTGNQPELFADVEGTDRKDMCADPICYAAKRDAQWKRDKAAAKEEGRSVIDGAEAASMCASWGGLNLRGTGFAALDERDYMSGTSKTYRERLGKKLEDLPVTLLREPTGKVHELVDAKAMAKLLPKTRAERARPSMKDKTPEQKKAELLKVRAGEAAQAAILAEVYQRVLKRSDYGRAIARTMLELAMSNRLGLGCVDWLERAGVVEIDAKLKTDAERDGAAERSLTSKLDKFTEQQLRALTLCFAIAESFVGSSPMAEAKEVLESLKIDAKAIAKSEEKKLRDKETEREKKKPKGAISALAIKKAVANAKGAKKLAKGAKPKKLRAKGKK